MNPGGGCHSRVYKSAKLAWSSRNEKVEAPLYEIENIQHDNLIPFSGPGGRRFKSSLPDQFFPNQLFSYLQPMKFEMNPWNVARVSQSLI
jgi:hypothetical protein